MHSIAHTQKILTFKSLTGECRQQKTHPACTIHKTEYDYLYGWLKKKKKKKKKQKRSNTQKSHTQKENKGNPRDIAGNTEEEEVFVQAFHTQSTFWCSFYSNSRSLKTLLSSSAIQSSRNSNKSQSRAVPWYTNLFTIAV